MPLSPATPEVLARLAALLGPAGFLAGDDRPVRNRGDRSHLPPAEAEAVLRPASTAEVAAIMRICSRAGVGVTVQGGLTGLSGGAVPAPGQLALSLERMSGVEEVDRTNATLTALAGTPLSVVQDAAADAGLFYPVDLNARASCTIGGNVATNAGGNRVIRHGMTRAQVLGVEAVLADGTVISDLHKMMKNNAGFDIKQLFIGTEGQIGIVTRVLLRLRPAPRWTAAALLSVADYPAVMDCLFSAQESLAGDLSAFEVMWPDYWRIATAMPGRVAPYVAAEGALNILIEVQTQDGETGGSAFENWLETVWTRGLVSDAVVSRSGADLARFWALREAAAEIRPVFGPSVGFDIGIEPGRIGAFFDEARESLARAFPGRGVLCFGHVGDGNIHVQVARDGLDPAEIEHVEAILYRLTGAYAGTVTAEHGVGALKRDWLAVTRSAEEIAMMRRIKAAMDPMGLLNPGKVLPLAGNT